MRPGIRTAVCDDGVLREDSARSESGKQLHTVINPPPEAVICLRCRCITSAYLHDVAKCPVKRTLEFLILL